MALSFDRGLVPRVKLAARTMQMPGGKDALRKFNAVFRDAGILPIGTEILIKFTGEGQITLAIDGCALVDVDSPALTWALLDMFLGPKTVAANVKANVANGFASFLRVV
jgi:hypothetical protein